MTFRRDWASWLLLALALGCFAVGAFPQWDEWVDPATGDRVSERRFGIWSSPSFHYLHRDLGRGGFQTESGFRLLSWSSLLIFIGVGCVEALRWRHNAPAGRQHKASQGQGEQGIVKP